MATIKMGFIVIAIILAATVQFSWCASLDNRLAGGEDAPEGIAPYQVSLRTGASVTHFCGGAIIDKSWILTAAHCLIETDAQNITVVVGTNSRTGGNVRYRGQLAIPHLGYDPTRTNTTRHDIGLLRVDSPIQFTNLIQAIPLADKVTPAGSTLVMTGFGRLWYEGPRVDVLQILYTVSIGLTSCKEQLVNVSEVFNSHICTQTQEGEGACVGDSGGPVVGSGRLVGVISWGFRCAAGAPDVHTSVYYYRDWITQNVRAADLAAKTPILSALSRRFAS